MPPDVANPPPVTPTAGQKTERLSSPKAAQGKSSGVSKFAASVNAGLLMGVETAISATTGLNIRLPRPDYVELVRKVARTGKQARASTGAISESTAVPGVAHTRTPSAGNVAHSKTSKPSTAEFSNLNSYQPSSVDTPSPVSSPDLPPNNNISGIRRKPV